MAGLPTVAGIAAAAAIGTKYSDGEDGFQGVVSLAEGMEPEG